MQMAICQWKEFISLAMCQSTEHMVRNRAGFELANFWQWKAGSRSNFQAQCDLRYTPAVVFSYLKWSFSTLKIQIWSSLRKCSWNVAYE